jgi:uncharacterized protein with HEPN domain
MSRRDVRLLLEDISDAVAKIERYVRGLDHDSFLASEMAIDSVVRNLEIMGEAASRLSPEFTAVHPDIAWAQIVGLRHRIVHEYFGIDVELIWQILQDDLPRLKRRLETLRAELN